MTGASKAGMSRLCKEIDENVQASLTGPSRVTGPYLWIDAAYVKSTPEQSQRLGSSNKSPSASTATAGAKSLLIS
jgi:hypothetical protein